MEIRAAAAVALRWLWWRAPNAQISVSPCHGFVAGLPLVPLGSSFTQQALPPSFFMELEYALQCEEIMLVCFERFTLSRFGPARLLSGENKNSPNQAMWFGGARPEQRKACIEKSVAMIQSSGPLLEPLGKEPLRICRVLSSN